jgi:hypothetical protein
MKTMLSVACLAVLATGACAHRGKARVADAIAITAMTPDPDTPLKPGQKVSVSMVVRYSLGSVEEGEVALVAFANKDRRSLIEVQPAVPVMVGSGQVTLAAAFYAPSDTDKIRVGVILARESTALRTSLSKPAAEQTFEFQVR